MKLLADYLQSGDVQPVSSQAQNGATDAPSGGNASGGSPTAQLKRGMQISDVSALLGQGRVLSETTSADGLKTQVLEYLPGDRRVEVTYVDGLVIKFSISSR